MAVISSNYKAAKCSKLKTKGKKKKPELALLKRERQKPLI